MINLFHTRFALDQVCEVWIGCMKLWLAYKMWVFRWHILFIYFVSFYVYVYSCACLFYTVHRIFCREIFWQSEKNGRETCAQLFSNNFNETLYWQYETEVARLRFMRLYYIGLVCERFNSKPLAHSNQSFGWRCKCHINSVFSPLPTVHPIYVLQE